MVYLEKRHASKKISASSWWAREWLSLAGDIDEERHRAAKAYVNLAKVLGVDYRQSRVLARILGPAKKYLRIELAFEPFSDEEIKIIEEILKSSSLIRAELALGKLPSLLNEELAEHNINLIPASLDELKTRCTCEEAMIFCEHKAALLYFVTEQIDKDPLLYLKLRGVPDSVIALEDDFTDKSLSKLIDKLVADDDDTSVLSAREFLRDYNQALSNLKFDYRAWLKLLSDSPSFSENFNFKQFIESLYTELSIKVDSLYQPRKKPKRKTATYALAEDMFIELNLKATSYEDLFSFSIELEDLLFNYSLNQDLNLLSARLAFTLLLLQTAVLIIKEGLYSAELLFHRRKAFQIRYVPLFSNASLSERLKVLRNLYPDDLIKFRDVTSIGEPRDNFLKSINVNELLSFLVTKLIKNLNLKLKNFPPSDLKYSFLSYTEFELDNTEAVAISRNLNSWLAKLHIQSYILKPLLRLEEAPEEGCHLYVDLIDNDNSPDSIIPLRTVIDDKTKQNLAFTVLPKIYLQLNLIQEYVPDIKQIIATEAKAAPVLNMEKISEILISSKKILNILGVNVILPKSLEKILRPKLVVNLKTDRTAARDAFSVEDILEFSYEIALGEQRLSIDEFRALVKNSSGLVRFKQDYIMLAPEEVSSMLLKANEALPKIDSELDALHYLLSEKVNDVKLSLSTNLENLVKAITAPKEDVSLPENLKAELRPYQERGFKWLYANYKNGFGSCLADDMGLGKTLQVISLLLKIHSETASAKNKPRKASLVICPTSLIGNWFKETVRFAPDLKLSIYHGNKRTLDLTDKDLVITSYGLLRREITEFTKHEWNVLVIDEAQNIKNHQAQQTRAIKMLKAENYVAMSGTPVENSLSELWSIFDFVNPSYLRSLKEFTLSYAIPIEKYRDAEKISQLKKVISPFLLRRLKTDTSIIQDLPEKIIKDQFVYLTKEQTTLYQSILDASMAKIESSEGIERKGQIFKLITSLKQLCNHPSNFTKEKNSDVNLSGKALKLLDILNDVLLNREKALIFTQYHEMGEILQALIKTELGLEAAFYHGSLSLKEKDAMVEDFQSNPSKKIMIISLKAGGTGLNLTAANHVIHYDLWWNPAVENQATDRVFRIGQKKNVMVHRLINIGTFEEKINDLLKAKKELADLSVSASESWITEMSNSELREIFSL